VKIDSNFSQIFVKFTETSSNFPQASSNSKSFETRFITSNPKLSYSQPKQNQKKHQILLNPSGDDTKKFNFIYRIMSLQREKKLQENISLKLQEKNPFYRFDNEGKREFTCPSTSSFLHFFTC
jgi:hypothetical protein